MFAQERQHKITELLEQRRKIGVYDLQQLLGVSPATLRRDLAQLQRIGKLVRTHGGVLHTNFRTGEPAFERKVREASAAKARIAEVAVRLVPPNATVFVDAGTTTLEVGRRLLGRDDLTIFTNSLPLLNERRTMHLKVQFPGTIIHGHTPLQICRDFIPRSRQKFFDGTPQKRFGKWNLDTGIIYGGPLTALLLPEEEIVQVERIEPTPPDE